MGIQSALTYLAGFGNEHETEAVTGALPIGQFNPQQHSLGLYTEQFSSTAFTCPRAKNRRSWFYRIRPSVLQSEFKPLPTSSPINQRISTSPDSNAYNTPNPLRWNPFDKPEANSDFIEGMTTLVTNGNARLQTGIGIHLYHANQSMTQRYFYNADGELLIVPQQGEMLFYTECGVIAVSPGEIIVIPRGIKFRVDLIDKNANGYICENYGSAFELPERGPIGANGLANSRDFYYPKAHYEDTDEKGELFCKFSGELFHAEIDHSPLNVVAWVGNSSPYKYDLANFNTINSVSYDHTDPSIFTVLTSPSNTTGVANVDFVIFPPRWSVTEKTFRPPWYHRNIMSEFMGLVRGTYDAKEKGFVPGAASLHNCMTAHGPDSDAFETACNKKLIPEKIENTLAFMFESCYAMQPTKLAMHSKHLQKDYQTCWSKLSKNFSEKDSKTSSSSSRAGKSS